MREPTAGGRRRAAPLDRAVAVLHAGTAMIGRWTALAQLALVRRLVLSAAGIGVGVGTPAAAAPLAVVVRDDGDAAVARLRGQLADLDVVLIVVPPARRARGGRRCPWHR